MRQLVICSEIFLSTYENILSSGHLWIKNQIIHYALIESPDIEFCPEKSPNEVLVKKVAFSCNYREQSLIKYASSKICQNTNLIYYVIGSEFAGVIVNVGSNVTRFKIGDRVLCNGSYPDPHIAPGLPSNHASSELEVIHDLKLETLPTEMSFSVGAAFTIGAQTVYNMIDKLSIKNGDRILITGIKCNTSLFAINALKSYNIKMYGLSRTSVDEVFFKNMGIEKIFYLDKPVSEVLNLRGIKEYVEIYGKFNCVIDPFSDSYLLDILDLMAIGGRYITCGISNQSNLTPVSVNLNLELSKIITNNLSIIGNCLGSTQSLRSALADYSKKNLKVLIDDEIKDNDRIEEFMQKSFISKERLGKVVFKYV